MPFMNPYLNFNGNTEEAFNFYRSVFGGEFTMIQRFKDTPQGAKMSAVDQNKIMHIALPIGKNILMATDVLESMGQKFTLGNNSSVSLHVDSKEEAETLYNGLSSDGKIEVPLGEAPWDAYFGMFTDKFGVHWMVNYQYPKK